SPTHFMETGITPSNQTKPTYYFAVIPKYVVTFDARNMIAQDEFGKLQYGFLLQRRFDDIPPRVVERIACELSPEIPIENEIFWLKK
ncbi:MAG: hypothetical protein AABX47_09865, partial [Nanoarchaeota archaeon]